MIPDKAPKEDVFHGSEDLKKDAHIPSFDKYKELYVKSIENPEGESTLWCVNPVEESKQRKDIYLMS